MVDIGCGAGRFHDGLRSTVDLYIGIEPSDRMLLHASEFLAPGAAASGDPRVEQNVSPSIRNQPAANSTGDSDQLFIRGVGEHLPLQSGIADVVLLKSVLDQCYAPHQVISESYRILRDDGWLLVSLSNRRAYYAFFRNLYGRLRGHKGTSPSGVPEFSAPPAYAGAHLRKDRHFFAESHQFYFDMLNVLTMLRRERFEIVRQIPIAYFLFPLCLERLMPGRVMLRCIDLADRIGAAIMPQRGGGFIFAGQKVSLEEQRAKGLG
jgi:SAM-dependent methyltransferase